MRRIETGSNTFAADAAIAAENRAGWRRFNRFVGNLMRVPEAGKLSMPRERV